MKLYQVKYSGDTIADSVWFSSKRKANEFIKSPNFKKNHVLVEPVLKVDVPTDRDGLVFFLTHYKSDD